MHVEPATLRNFCGIAARSLPQKLLYCAGPVIGVLCLIDEFNTFQYRSGVGDSPEY